MRANKHREGGETRTHHLTELDGRLAHLIPNPNRDLGGEGKRKLISYTSLPPKPAHNKPRSGRSKKSSTASEVWVQCNCLRGGWVFTHLLEHFYFGAETLNGLVVLTFEVVCEACACKGCGV